MNLNAIFILFISISVFAGGSSTVGPGAPMIEYRCSDATQNALVTVLSSPPNYEQQRVSVETKQPASMILDNVNRTSPMQPGDSLIFQGQRFTLVVAATAPTFVDGKVMFGAALTDTTTDQPAFVLDCQLISNN